MFIIVGFLHGHPISLNKFLNHTASFAASAAATYSDLVVLFCLLEDQVTIPFARLNIYPVVDLQVSTSFA